MYILLISVFVLSLKGLCYINFHLKFSHFTTFSHTKKKSQNWLFSNLYFYFLCSNIIFISPAFNPEGLRLSLVN